MEKNKIAWCLKQKKGIELIKPNNNLSNQYFKEAEETLEEIKGKQSKWETIMAYYACYNALYAILMKAGIKCEIHDCTIELINVISGCTKEDYNLMLSLKEKRIQAQYYLKKVFIDDLKDIKSFIFKCREISESLDINELRGRLNDKKK